MFQGFRDLKKVENTDLVFRSKFIDEVLEKGASINDVRPVASLFSCPLFPLKNPIGTYSFIPSVLSDSVVFCRLLFIEKVEVIIKHTDFFVFQQMFLLMTFIEQKYVNY